MLRYERDIVAQMEAIAALRLFPSLETRLALTYTIEREQVFYRVRMSACQCLAKVLDLSAFVTVLQCYIFSSQENQELRKSF